MTDPRSKRSSAFPGFGSMDGDTSELIGNLTALRHTRGLSQTQVAARMGTSQSALARLESGQSDLRMSTLERYADALNVTIGFALTESTNGPDPAEGAQ